MPTIWTSRTRTQQPIGPAVSVASDISPPAWLTLPVPGGMVSGHPGGARNLVRPHEVAVGQDAFNYFRQISTPEGLAAENFAGSSAGATQWLVTTDALCGATQLTLLCALYRRGAIDASAQWLNFRTDNVHSLDVFASTATTLTFGADWAGAWNGASQQTVTVGDGLVTIAATIRQDGARFFCNGRATGTKTGSSWSVGSTPYQVSINRGARSPILVLAAWKTALPDSQIAALSANPWQLFAPERKPVFYSLSGGGAAALTGSLAASGTVSGALTTAIRVAASVSASANVTASLTTAIRPAATISASAAVSGALTTAIGLNGSLSATASVSGDISGAAALASSVSTSAIVTGALTTAIRLNASLAVAATVSATLTDAAAAALAASITASASVSAALTGGTSSIWMPVSASSGTWTQHSASSGVWAQA